MLTNQNLQKKPIFYIEDSFFVKSDTLLDLEIAYTMRDCGNLLSQMNLCVIATPSVKQSVLDALQKVVPALFPAMPIKTEEDYHTFCDHVISNHLKNDSVLFVLPNLFFHFNGIQKGSFEHFRQFRIRNRKLYLKQLDDLIRHEGFYAGIDSDALYFDQN